MLRRKSFLILGFMICVIALALAVSCKKEPFLNTVTQTPHLGLPRDIEQLGRFSFEELRVTDGFDAFKNQLLDGLNLQPVYQQVKTKVNFDLWQDIDLVVAAQRGAPSSNNFLSETVFIVRGKFDRPVEKLEALRQYLGEYYLIQPPAFTESTHTQSVIKTYGTRAQSQYNDTMVLDLNFAFPAPNIMVFSFSPELFKNTLDVIAGNAPGITQNQTWMAMLQQFHIGASIWCTGAMTPELVNFLRGSSPDTFKMDQARKYYTYLTLIGSPRFETGLICEDIAKAGEVADGVRTYLANLKTIVEPLTPITPTLVTIPEKLFVLAEVQTAKISLPLDDNLRRSLLREFGTLAAQAKTGHIIPTPTPTPTPAPVIAPPTMPGATPAPPPTPSVEMDPNVKVIDEVVTTKLQAVKEFSYNVVCRGINAQGQEVAYTDQVSHRRPNDFRVERALDKDPSPGMTGAKIIYYLQGDDIWEDMKAAQGSGKEIAKMLSGEFTKEQRLRAALDHETRKIRKVNSGALPQGAFNPRFYLTLFVDVAEPFRPFTPPSLKIEKDDNAAWTIVGNLKRRLGGGVMGRMVIGKSDGLLQRFELLGADGAVLRTCTVSQINLNPGLTDAQMKFDVPKDYKPEKIIDVTQQALDLMR